MQVVAHDIHMHIILHFPNRHIYCTYTIITFRHKMMSCTLTSLSWKLCMTTYWLVFTHTSISLYPRGTCMQIRSLWSATTNLINITNCKLFTKILFWVLSFKLKQKVLLQFYLWEYHSLFRSRFRFQTWF